MDNKLTNNKWYLGLFQFCLIFALSGCNFVEGIFSHGHEEEFSLPNIDLSPQYCGDNLQNISSYPTKIYPVFFDADNDIHLIENSEEYRFIKSNVCENVMWGYSPDLSKVLVLGYFLDKNQAEELKNTVGNYLSGVEVGVPYEMKVAPSELGDLAKLNQAQVQELLRLDRNNQRNITFKPIVPTYVPEGFNISSFEIRDTGIGGPSYEMLYENNNNLCFQISGDSGGWGDGATDSQPVEVISPALGKVILNYTETSRVLVGSGLSFGIQPGVLGGRQNYSFSSPPGRSCRSISIQEAVSIVESLQYLNPLQTTQPSSTNNPFQSMSFPKDSCGDSLPEDPDAYPVEFYPVFIDYSERNLELAQSQFCRDSLKIYRKSLDEDYIQVSSFIGRERAHQFKEFIESEFVNVEVGDARIIEAR